MDALASRWAAQNKFGVRHVRADEVRRILGAGSRAFNLRVADPYLPYQKQGLGFTWSFFTPRDKQDVHVHGLPAVEIYGVIAGLLQVWHKPMAERGARTWRCVTLEAGDWLEVEPLHCHFAFWPEPEGLGTVFKAAGTGELAGVGKIGSTGKTTCQDCNVRSQCLVHPGMIEILDEYAKPFEDLTHAHKVRAALEKEGYVTFMFLIDKKAGPLVTSQEAGRFFREAGHHFVIDTPHARKSVGIRLEKALLGTFVARGAEGGSIVTGRPGPGAPQGGPASPKATPPKRSWPGVSSPKSASPAVSFKKCQIYRARACGYCHMRNINVCKTHRYFTQGGSRWRCP